LYHKTFGDLLLFIDIICPINKMGSLNINIVFRAEWINNQSHVRVFREQQTNYFNF